MSINLDGAAANYFRADYAATIENDTNTLSFGCWMNHDSLDPWGKTIIRENTGGGSKEMYILYHDGSGNIRCFVRNSGATSAVAVTDTSPPSIGVWCHAVATYDGSTVRLYVNGVSVGTPASLTGNVRNNSTDPVYFGYDPSSSGDSFDGSIADIFCEKRVMTPNEILSLYNGRRYVPSKDTLYYYPCLDPSGNPVDRGPHNHATTVTGTLTYAPDVISVRRGMHDGVSFVERTYGAAPSVVPFWNSIANPPVCYGWGG